MIAISPRMNSNYLVSWTSSAVSKHSMRWFPDERRWYAFSKITKVIGGILAALHQLFSRVRVRSLNSCWKSTESCHQTKLNTTVQGTADDKIIEYIMKYCLELVVLPGLLDHGAKFLLHPRAQNSPAYRRSPGWPFMRSQTSRGSSANSCLFSATAVSLFLAAASCAATSSRASCTRIRVSL